MTQLYNDNEQNDEFDSVFEENGRNRRLHSFVDEYGIDLPQISVFDHAKKYVGKKCSSLTCEYCINSFLNKIPLIRCLKEYNIRKNLFGDIIAGITVAIMHIPQGRKTLVFIVYKVYLFYFIIHNRYGLWSSCNITTGPW